MAIDPKEKFKKPPLSGETQSPPGTDTKMEPKPDYGEESYTGSGKLRGKTALITGGDSGIGKAVALAFAREGADIAFSFLSEDEMPDAQETIAFVQGAGKKAIGMIGDMKSETICEKLVEETVEQFGKLDILVNNAAYQMTYDSIMEVSEMELEKVFRTNVYGTFFMTKAAYQRMEAGANIITTTSIQAFHPSPILLPYSCSKGALVVFTKAFAQEAIKKGIRVNAVAPGPVWTPLIPSTMPDPTNFGATNPTERPAQPAELAPIYVLLASDEASYANGEIWTVTGGAMAR